MTDFILYLTLGVFVALGVVVSLVVLYPPKRVGFSLLLIASVVSAPLFLYQPILGSLGYSVKLNTSLDAKYISHRVSPDRIWIYIWIYDRSVEEPRAYRVPFSKETEEELEGAKKDQERGIPQRVTSGNITPEGTDFAYGTIKSEPLPSGAVAK